VFQTLLDTFSTTTQDLWFSQPENAKDTQWLGW
jgi:hypothetical protein